MRDLAPIIAGEAITTSAWAHIFSASDVITNPRDAMATIAALDAGTHPTGTDDRIVARVGLSTLDDCKRAIGAAAKVQRAWSRRPAHERFRVVEIFHRMLNERRSELVDALVVEGHPANSLSGKSTACTPAPAPPTSRHWLHV